MMRPPTPNRVRFVVMVAVLFVLLVAACSVDNTMPIPDCESGDSGIIVAQSVPTGQLLPCFNALPPGWSTQKVAINRDGTVVRLDSDRAGTSAAVLHFTETCAVDDAVAVTSNHDGATALEHIDRLGPGFRAHRYYLFPGACVSWDFDFDNNATASLAAELEATLLLVPRELVNESIRANFIDEDV